MSAHDQSPTARVSTNDQPKTDSPPISAASMPDGKTRVEAHPQASAADDETANPVPSVDVLPPDRVLDLAARLDSLSSRIESRLDDALMQREAFDRLYEDFDRCRKHESLALVLPWINGLIRIHDNIGKTCDALAPSQAPAADNHAAARHLIGVQEELEVLLENNGVVLYREADERFNSSRQSVLRLEPTARPEQDGRIAASVRPGFELGERVLRKERVSVYKHRPESASSSDGPSAQSEQSTE